MKLIPYPRIPYRRKKTVIHYYNADDERWCLVSEQEVVLWQRDWLDLSGVRGTYEGWLWVEDGSQQDHILARGHDYWLETSERACDDALAKGQVGPDHEEGRTMYIGFGGVTVIVASKGGRHFLVTALQKMPPFDDPDDPPSLEECERFAVRNAGWQSSHLSRGGQ